MGGCAWVTLATNDSYSLGALVLAHSLRQANTVHQLAVLVTPGVTSVMREKLASVFNEVIEVNILDSKDEANLRLLKRPELGITFTKLHCWRLTQFEKCVFLDADTMVLANADELFDKEEFSAAPDVGWPDCFNSGVFVFRPSEETYKNLVQFAIERGSFDGGDQGLLNLYFSDWAHKDISKHLPFIYNTCSTACYSYLPAFKQFGGNVKIIHFIGNSKPWLQYFDSESHQVHVGSDIQHLQFIVQQWWNLFCSFVHPLLSPEMAGLAGAFARLTLGMPRTAEQAMLEDQLRRQGWEVGNIDYMGRDSFDNIWSKICETLNTSPTSPPIESKEPSQAVPVEEVKQVDKPVEQPEEVKETVPKSPEGVAGEEIKPPVEGITDSKSQVTQFSEDTQTQTSIPDSSILPHTTTQFQQPPIPLQEQLKEIQSASKAITKEAPNVINTSKDVQPDPEKEVAMEPIMDSKILSAVLQQAPPKSSESVVETLTEISDVPSTPLPLVGVSVPSQPACPLPKEPPVATFKTAESPKPTTPPCSPLTPTGVSVPTQSKEPPLATSKTVESPKPTTPPCPPLTPTGVNVPPQSKEPPLATSKIAESAKPTTPPSEPQKPKMTAPASSTAPSVVASKQGTEKPLAAETSTLPSSKVEPQKPAVASTPSKTEPEKQTTQSGKAAPAKPAAVKPSDPLPKSTGSTGDVGPTPPPRKGSGGATAAKKPAKGKK